MSRAAPSRIARWLVLVLGLALASVALTGCSYGAELRQVQQGLLDEGFDDAGVWVRFFESREVSEDRVEVVLIGSSMDREAAWEIAATAVWEKLPVEFDYLLVEYEGEVDTATYAELKGQFGPRPDGLVEQSPPGVVVGTVARVVAVFVVIGAIALVPVIVLVRRDRRRRRRLRGTGRPAQ